MKIKYLKLKNWLLLSLGTLLGLQMGCGKDHNEEPISGMYGCPEGTYHVMGTVVNEEGEPVAGINVSHLDTTGVDGHYEIRFKGSPESNVAIYFKDSDGEQNGHYRDTTVSVVADRSAFHDGHGNWDYGTADVEKDVTLQRIDK